MAPTPRSNHAKHEAGLLAEESAARPRGRRYIHVADTVKEGQTSARTLSPFCKDTSNPKEADHCGLSSKELSQVYDMNHRRSRKHICHGSSKCCLPSTPSIASDPVSEDSVAFYRLGHREKVAEQWDNSLAEAQLEAGILDDEATAGLSSHFLNRRGRLGFGKKKYGSECKWVGYHHHSCRLDAFGKEERKNVTKRFFHLDQQKDHLFEDQIEEKEKPRNKKMFKDREEQSASHASKDLPLGVSTQTDLDSQGFLGKSKGRVECATQHISNDPISDKSGEPRDQNDLSCYGLNQRGKRKFLVQSNLATGCRHNASQAELRAAMLLRSSSMPVLERELPPNQTPYYQDDLPESERAIKDELLPVCRGNRECERRLHPRHGKVEADSTWDVLTWTPRMVDQITAAKFIEGENSMHPTNDEEHKERVFRAILGTTKRSFGNAHNKSDFRFDYNDDPTYKTEHVCEVKRKDIKRDVSPSTGGCPPTGGLLRWGAGHGRKKFDVDDHIYRGGGGPTYMSFEGVQLGARSKPVPAHMDPNRKEGDQNFGLTVLDADGHPISFKSRSHKVMKDSVFEHMNDDVLSDHSNSMGVVGMRRTTDLIRPHSARRFPQKDFQKEAERLTPRSLTPRARSEARVPLAERPIWKK